MFSLYLATLVPFNIPDVQRVYMSSDSIQARRVFRYNALFSFCITLMIVLISLFVCAEVPSLSVGDIWGYIMQHIPSAFKGCIAVALLAMAINN